MADRDEILANFQAFTGLDDVAVCLDILEQKGWDLMAAANSVMPQQYPPGSAEHSSGSFHSYSASAPLHGYSAGVQVPLLHGYGVVGPPDYVDLTLDSPVKKECRLGVYFHTRLISLQLPLDTTVAQVKEKLVGETGIAVLEQQLTGWPKETVTDQMSLEEAGLGDRDVFHLKLVQVSMLERSSSFGTESLDGASVVVERTTQDETVEESRSSPESPMSSSSHYSSAQEGLPSSDEDEAEGGVAIDDYALFAEEPESPVSSEAMRQPLIPQHCKDPVEALTHFTRNFEKRYGSMHPLFFVGSLSDAVAEATGVPLLSGIRKPILLYIHHDASVISNVVCSQLLCSESVVNYLTINYISWAWDVTFHEQKIKLLEMVRECFGSLAKTSVDEIRAESLPVMLIVVKTKGILEIKNIVQGETNLDALMATLITAVEDHQLQVQMETREEQLRLTRVDMIQEQNRAYEESLFADREKEKQKVLEEQQRLEQERAEEVEKQEKETRLLQLKDSVPPEPDPDCSEKLSTIRVRFPDGTNIMRRFLATHKLADLLNFVGSKDYLTSDYKILTSFPRRDLCGLDLEQTLEQAGLCPQETLFIEER